MVFKITSALPQCNVIISKMISGNTADAIASEDVSGMLHSPGLALEYGWSVTKNQNFVFDSDSAFKLACQSSMGEHPFK
jgi:hypothetical protein